MRWFDRFWLLAYVSVTTQLLLEIWISGVVAMLIGLVGGATLATATATVALVLGDDCPLGYYWATMRNSGSVVAVFWFTTRMARWFGGAGGLLRDARVYHILRTAQDPEAVE